MRRGVSETFCNDYLLAFIFSRRQEHCKVDTVVNKRGTADVGKYTVHCTVCINNIKCTSMLLGALAAFLRKPTESIQALKLNYDKKKKLRKCVIRRGIVLSE